LHRFREEPSISQKSLHLATPLAFNPADGAVTYTI